MIRHATGTDAGIIASIYNHYINHTVATFEESPISSGDMFARMEKVKHSRLPWLVAEKEKKVIGYAYASKWNERAAYRHTAEVSVYLSNDCLSGGWGTKLYQALFAEFQKLSIHMVIGGITLPNPASVALHEKFGMEKVAHFKEVGYKFGNWLDVGYWQGTLHT